MQNTVKIPSKLPQNALLNGNFSKITNRDKGIMQESQINPYGYKAKYYKLEDELNKRTRTASKTDRTRNESGVQALHPPQSSEPQSLRVAF